MALTHTKPVEQNMEVLIMAKQIGEQLAELSKLANCKVSDLVNPNGLIMFYAEKKLIELS
jgi:hypothetical protein